MISGEHRAAAVLAYNPFAEDAHADGDRKYFDRIVTARKPGNCFICDLPVEAGTNVRSIVGIVGGEFFHGRICEPCCDAIAEAGMRPMESTAA